MRTNSSKAGADAEKQHLERQAHNEKKLAGGTGLRGEDKQQGDLRDLRGGTRDTGSAVDLPEGLKRPPKGPYDKDRGRDMAPTHPKPKE
jgi:hypothetical protein